MSLPQAGTPELGGHRVRASHFIVARPVAILMVFLAVMVFGYLSYDRLPITLMPELTYPTLTVRTEYPGAAPEEVENDVSRPIEEQLGVIAGVARLSSVSRAGVSDVVLEFAWETDMSEATQDVLEKLDLVVLPEEADRPLILHYDPSLDPVMELSLSGSGERFEGEAGLRRLRRVAELRVEKELEPIKGVAAVRVRGGLEEEIHVALDEEALRRTGISIQQVIDRLEQENINVAGGTLKEGRTEYLVRTLNEYRSVEQIGDTVVTSVGGREVRIRDLGQVALSHKEREIVTRADGAESVQIDVYREGDANIVSLAGRIKELLGQLDLDEPRAARPPPAQRSAAPPAGLAERVYDEEGARLAVLADRSLFIESSIRELFESCVVGGLLAVLVLYIFLRNGLSTAIISVAIPMSLLISFAPLHLLGVSLNIMSLGGLALGIGNLVDSSIVVLESIHRCREEGDDPRAGAIRGTIEVWMPVWVGTLTSIAVFFPMVFVEGIAGQAFGDLGVAVVVSQLASVAVALYFIPMLATRAGLGLGVVGVVGFVLGLSWLATRAPYVAVGLAGAVLLLLGAGFVYAVVACSTGRIDLGERGRAAMGLWRFAALEKLQACLADPPRIARFGPVRGVAAIAWCATWGYYLARFAVGIWCEWFVGKPLLLGTLGATALVTRHVVPAATRTFGFAARWVIGPVGAGVDRLGQAYPRLLRTALANPLATAAIVILTAVLTWALASSLPSELLPEVHQGEFTVEAALPVGTPLEHTAAILAPVEAAILAEREQIRSLILTYGYDAASSTRSDEGEHTARFRVVLEESARSAAAEERVVARLRQRFRAIPDLETRIVRPLLFSAKTPIEIEVHGDDLVKLKRYSDQAAAAVATLPELADVETSLHSGAPEVQIVYDRERLARYGLNIRQVAELVRAKVRGTESTRFNLEDRRIPIFVRLELEDRETVEQVRAIIVNPGGERPIQLAAVADVTLGEGPSEVRRIDGQRVAVIGANLASGTLSSASWKIRELLERRIDWPETMGFAITGQNAEWERSRASLLGALLLSVFLVYVIMAAEFESLVQPLVIMLTIPLALFGTMIALKLFGQSLSVVVLLGIIMLVGVVVNNAIVLLDYVNILRGRGLLRDEAVVMAGSVRLRPILMTTATTVLGLLPMAAGLGDAAEIRRPMALAVIAGLVSSTALTLVVIPVVYVWADRLRLRLLGRPESAESEGARGSAVGGLPAPDAGPVGP